METVRSVNMEWSIPDTFYSDYLYTLQGQLEYMVLWFIKEKMKGKWNRTPMFWYGAQNDIALYLEHPAYSPFLYNPRHGNPKMPLDWDMRNVPAGQEHLVDENYLPKNL
jgi:hypothetical protein